MIGEIGGDAEERAAAFIAENVTKPVVGYVAGFTAPEGKTMGHAGAIVSGSSGTAPAKQEALEAVGVRVGKTPSETARLMREMLGALTCSGGPGLAPRPLDDVARGSVRSTSPTPIGDTREPQHPRRRLGENPGVMVDEAELAEPDPRALDPRGPRGLRHPGDPWSQVRLPGCGRCSSGWHWSPAW